jgi:hypothetical protein
MKTEITVAFIVIAVLILLLLFMRIVLRSRQARLARQHGGTLPSHLTSTGPNTSLFSYSANRLAAPRMADTGGEGSYRPSSPTRDFALPPLGRLPPQISSQGQRIPTPPPRFEDAPGDRAIAMGPPVSRNEMNTSSSSPVGVSTPDSAPVISEPPPAYSPRN